MYRPEGVRKKENLRLKGLDVAEKRVARNIYFDMFAAKYQTHYSLPYSPTSGDWVQLDQITNKGPLAPRMTLEVFERGCNNYFLSEIGSHTLRHLCSMFVPYWRQPLDRFGKPREKASQVGSQVREPNYASWHRKFLAACWKVAQTNKATLDAVTELLEEVVDMDEVTAFKRLKEIEQRSS